MSIGLVSRSDQISQQACQRVPGPRKKLEDRCGRPVCGRCRSGGWVGAALARHHGWWRRTNRKVSGVGPPATPGACRGSGRDCDWPECAL